jgi:hypothetical protein
MIVLCYNHIGVGLQLTGGLTMTHSDLPFDGVFDSFGDFAGFYSEDSNAWPDLEIKGEISVADVINQWLWWDRGVARCFASFEIFLKAVSYLIDDYHRNGAGTIAAYRTDSDGTWSKFRVTSVFGYQPTSRHEHYLHPIFNRDNFQGALWVNTGQQNQT